MSFRLIIFQCIELIAQSTTQLQTQYITAPSWQGFIADFHYIQAALWCLLVEDLSLSLLLNSYPHERSPALSSIVSKYTCVDRVSSSHDAAPFMCVGLVSPVSTQLKWSRLSDGTEISVVVFAQCEDLAGNLEAT
jgi:hypothetical protein